MSPHETAPSAFIAKFRARFCQLVQPGRVLDAVQVCELQRQLNTAYEVTKDLEEEFAILSEIPTPPRPSEESGQHEAQVLLFRPKARFRVIVGGPGGGDAA